MDVLQLERSRAEQSRAIIDVDISSGKETRTKKVTEKVKEKERERTRKREERKLVFSHDPDYKQKK